MVKHFFIFKPDQIEHIVEYALKGESQTICGEYKNIDNRKISMRTFVDKNSICEECATDIICKYEMVR